VKSEQTKGIVLSRTDYGEADRIVTVITPDQGKRRLMVKGVRRMKSKMAGGIELFSVSELSYIKGRGDIDTLISARLDKYYSNIVQDIDRVQLGYELIKQLNRTTEDNPEEDYFNLLETAFKALDDSAVNTELIRLWFQAQLLRLAGYTPNLQTDCDGNRLEADSRYNFDYESMAFMQVETGKFAKNEIKCLRVVLFADASPKILSQIVQLTDTMPAVDTLIRQLFTQNLQS